MSCWHLELGSTGKLSLSAVNKSHTEGLQSMKLLALFPQTADMWCPQNKLGKLCWEMTTSPLPALLVHLSWCIRTLLEVWVVSGLKIKADTSEQKEKLGWLGKHCSLDEPGANPGWDSGLRPTGGFHWFFTLSSLVGTSGIHFPQLWKFCFSNQQKIFFLDTLHKDPNCDILQAPKRGPLEHLGLSIWSNYSCSPSSKQLPNTMCFSTVLIKS